MPNPFVIAEDLALKTYLAGMTVSDEKNMGRTVQVWFGYPDVEIRDQKFPFVTIDLLDIVPANDRQIQGRIADSDYQGTIAASGSLIYTYDVPVAYDIVYQITSHSRHPRHDRALLIQLLQKFPSKYGKLAVPNQLNTETAYRSMFLDGYTKPNWLLHSKESRVIHLDYNTERYCNLMEQILVELIQVYF